MQTSENKPLRINQLIYFQKCFVFCQKTGEKKILFLLYLLNLYSSLTHKEEFLPISASVRPNPFFLYCKHLHYPIVLVNNFYSNFRESKPTLGYTDFLTKTNCMRVFRILTLLVIFSLLDDSLAKTKDQSEFVFVKLHKQELKVGPAQDQTMQKNFA
jgi:hypothetical protein